MESDSNNIENTKIEIKDALTCFICTAKVLDPLLCPQCKKMVCSNCIKKWFDEGHNKCPYCQIETSLDKMISLPFMNQLSDYFIKEIDNKKEEKEEKKRYQGKGNNVLIDEDYDSNVINENEEEINERKNLSKSHAFPNKFNQNEENINNENNQMSNIKKGEACYKHKSEIIEYFCLNCGTKHCPKCLLFFTEDSKIHEGHKIISIEEKNKFNIEEIKKEINNLTYVKDEINKSNNDLDIEINILEKKEEFLKKVIEEFKELVLKAIGYKKYNLEIKTKLNQSKLERISNIENSYTDSINNFIERNDENGFKEYQDRIKDLLNFNKIQNIIDNNIDIKTTLNIYETDFIDMDINEYEEVIGDIYFNIEGIDKQLHLRLNGEAIDEVLINLQIELDNNLVDIKDKYYGLLLFKNKNQIITISLDEKMVHDKILIMGKTIMKGSLGNVVSLNKCHIKLILVNFNC